MAFDGDSRQWEALVSSGIAQGLSGAYEDVLNKLQEARGVLSTISPSELDTENLKAYDASVASLLEAISAHISVVRKDKHLALIGKRRGSYFMNHSSYYWIDSKALLLLCVSVCVCFVFLFREALRRRESGKGPLAMVSAPA